MAHLVGKRYFAQVLCFSAALASTANSQELSEARFVGAMEGAANACAAAFPSQAKQYENLPMQLVGCHMDQTAFATWYARVRAQKDEYAKGFEEGGRSLASDPTGRRSQCRILVAIQCTKDTNPLKAAQ